MTETPNQLESADILRIMEALPHRYPFLLVDKIIEIDGDRSCIGIKNVTMNEPQFMGHFPARPLFPGVLIVEGMAQTAGAVCVLTKLSQLKRPTQVFFMTIDKAKFRKPVVPGDVIVTGTPTGAGARFDPPRYLKPGDVIEVEAERVGVLRNGVADEA